MNPSPPRPSGALAWSEAVAMSAAEIDDFLSGRWIVRLGTNGRDGYPVITPMWYYWDGHRLYVLSNRNRLAVKNLTRDPRCVATIDMDLRPVMGFRTNLAKAVMIKGDATVLDLVEIGGSTVGTWFEGGPFARPMPLAQAAGLIVERYRIQERDGALVRPTAGPSPDDPDAAARRREALQSVIITITPKSIKAWDFSKGPFD